MVGISNVISNIDVTYCTLNVAARNNMINPGDAITTVSGAAAAAASRQSHQSIDGGRTRL